MRVRSPLRCSGPNALAGLDLQGSVVTYCASGYRSLTAASVLADAGFVDVFHLLGGYGAWEGTGLPTSTGDAAGGVGATPQVGARTAKALVEAGDVLLNVGETDEWHGQHAPTAMLVPMGQVRTRSRAPPRPQGSRRVPIRRTLGSGHRRFHVWGFDAVNLSGGMCAWAAAGLPVATDADAGLVVIGGATELRDVDPGAHRRLVIPDARFFVRNRFPSPALDSTTWRLAVNGVVERPLRLSLRDLQNMPSRTLVATLGAPATDARCSARRSMASDGASAR